MGGAVHLTSAERARDRENPGEYENNQNNDGHNPQNNKCLFHPNSDHWTDECSHYLSKSVEERFRMLKEKAACWSCLRVGHRLFECKRKVICGESGCKEYHHKTIHTERKYGGTSACEKTSDDSGCLLQIQRIKAGKGWMNVLWDNAASLCFITYSKAKEENRRGTPIQLKITKVGGIEEKLVSRRYQVPLLNQYGKTVLIEAYGIDKITSDIQNVSIDGLEHIFKGVSIREVTRPTGPVDLLIGYEYAGFHPQLERKKGHLLLLRNQFGKCLGRKHPGFQETHTKSKIKDARVHHVAAVNVEDFYNIEGLGVACSSRCGGCKCGKCPIGSSDYTLKEERELKLIESKLVFDSGKKRWTAEYPWIRSPEELPDNKRAAMGRLRSTEKRLAKNPAHVAVYQKQIEDLIHRGVAKKLTYEDLESYDGPIHYISHHEVLKPDSKSTPVRIVFNSSANYMGNTLNEYSAKGPNLLNNLLGVLVRFRKNEVAMMGDMKKMYQSVKIGTVEQHTHRFL